jgi:phosphopantetheinyl transferase
MPLFYQQHINQHTKLAIWKIEESEEFFSQTVPLQRDITHPHKRLQHLAARYLLRFLFPDFPYEEILIADTRKPYLENEAYHFSISHCGDYAAAIVSKNERVGIDIEMPSEKIFRIAHKFTSDEEIHQVRSTKYEAQTNEKQETRNEKPETVLTLIWCAKETMFKWYGLGNVDFKTMLRTNFTTINEEGISAASITINETEIPIDIHYKMFNKIFLTFLHHNEKI